MIMVPATTADLVERDAMYRAMALAERGPEDGPRVGCVVLSKDKKIVGEGFATGRAKPHAEAVALRQAGEQARGGTAVVTMEPCNHFGKTPPCRQALIDAGIERVIFAVPDPNPRAAGGAVALRAAGIEVVGGVLEGKAALGNQAWLTAMRRSNEEGHQPTSPPVNPPSGQDRAQASPKSRRHEGRPPRRPRVNRLWGGGGDRESSQMWLLLEATAVAFLAVVAIYIVRLVSRWLAEVTNSPDVLASQWSWDRPPSEIAEGLFIALLTIIGYMTILIAATSRLWGIVKTPFRRRSET